MKFTFGEYTTKVYITDTLPRIENKNALFVADENTLPFAQKMNAEGAPVCVLKSGEENKNFEAVEKILSFASDAFFSRDSVMVGVGGGVIGDLTGFASSVYKRGCGLVLVPTTLLAMADASIGGKTGFDLFGIKNLAGTFYPAKEVYMPLETLSTLPDREFKSGLAEVIKTAILAGDSRLDDMEKLLQKSASRQPTPKDMRAIIKNSVTFKGKIASEDFKESSRRRLLNLGHTFAHALETACGLGTITHGEAVAWGIVQACGLGTALGVTPLLRAKKIISLIKSFGYDCPSPHPLAGTALFTDALKNDKKKNKSSLVFILPDKKSARAVALNGQQETTLDALLKDGFIL